MATSLDTPETQALIQQGTLVRRIQRALLPRFMYRASVSEAPEKWVGNTGETRTYSRKGRISPDARPTRNGQDPGLVAQSYEQWEVSIQKYPRKGAMDIDMPTSVQSIVDRLLEDSHSLAVHSGDTLNIIARAPLYNAAMAGWTVADGAQTATTALRVRRINGFTRARRPDLAAGSPVKYNPVTSANPLKIKVNGVLNEVIAVTPTATDPDTGNVVADDELGPGILTLRNAVTVADRDIVRAEDATWIHRVGQGNNGKIDNVTSANPLRMVDIRAVVARFNIANAPRHKDGFYHVHMHPIPNSQIFGDPEFQRLTQGGLGRLPDFFLFKEQALALGMGCVFLDNNQAPHADTINLAVANQGVIGNVDPTNEAGYSVTDPLGFEVVNGSTAAAQPVHHTLISAADSFKEYQQDNALHMTDAGMTGIIGPFRQDLQSDGLQIDTQGITFIMQAPMNRHVDRVPIAWKYIGGFVVAPDGLTGDRARFKRQAVIESGS